MFGEIAFFTEQPRTVSAVARDYTSLVRIRREEFLQLLREKDAPPEDLETFYAIK